MAAFITRALRSQLEADGLDADAFVSEFDDWKSLGAAGEYDSYYFGKDGAYANPKVGGVAYDLRHVHLVPIINQERLSLWEKLFRRRGRKTSDRALVYATDSRGRHLLIQILEEPDAHTIAEMRTQEDAQIMKGFAKVAEAFLHDGSILA